MILLELFLSFLQIGLLSIGGGMAAIPLIQNQVVNNHNWLTINEFTDLITIAEMTPGPIAINSASFVGIKIAGISGAIVATIGCITPSIFIITLISYLYFKYKELPIIKNILTSIRPAIIALIISAGISISKIALFENNNINFISLFILLYSFIMLRKFKIIPIITMFSSFL